MDIKPVFNHYKAVAYMCTYLSKTEDEYSHAMNEALKDMFERELDNYEQMKSLTYAYLIMGECSVQESVYHILPGQWLGKTFTGVVFASSNIPEKRSRMCLGDRENFELSVDSTRIFKRHMVDRYIDCPESVFRHKVFDFKFFLFCKIFGILLYSTK